MPSETVRDGANNVLLVHVDTEDFASLPTSDPGIAGALWNNGGVVMVSAG